MAAKVSKPVNGVVKASSGNTISQIAKANNLSTKEVLDLNPALKNNPKYKGGNTIFSGTNVRVQPKSVSNPVQQTGTVGFNEGLDADKYAKESKEISATPSTPYMPTFTGPSSAPPVKSAPIDTILFDNDTVPIEIMEDLLFENIGGQELINIARNDTVNGQPILYQPIKNLTAIQQQYNPNNIVSLQDTSDKYFQNFPIKFENKIPSPGTGPDGSYVYIDSSGISLVVEAINLQEDEQLEVEITISGTILEYETEI